MYEQGDDKFESCAACAGMLLGDCIAIACCPWALVNCIHMMFFKVPYFCWRKCSLKDKWEVPEREGEDEKAGMASSAFIGKMLQPEEACEMTRDACVDNKCRALESEPEWFSEVVGNWGFGRTSFPGDF